MEIPHQINIDPENKQKLVETNLSAPNSWQSLRSLLEGNSIGP